MKRSWLWLTPVAFALALPTVRADEAKWLTSYDDAVAAAKKESKVVLIDFTGSDWCGWCMKLKAEVFEKKEFQEWAAKNAILLELDFPRKKQLPDELKKQNDELKKKFGIRGYPTIVFVDGEGKELGRSGYVKGGPAEWIKAAEAAIKQKGEPAKAAPKGEGKPGAPAAGPKAGEWGTSLEGALGEARKGKKLVLADFTGSDWCGWCMKLKKEVFDTEAFKKWAAKSVVLLEVDFPQEKAQSAELKEQNAKLQEKHGIQGYPTILLLDADGNKVGQLGYVPGGPEGWIKKAQEILDGHPVK